MSAPTLTPPAPAPLVSQDTERRASGVTPRVVVVCLALAAFFGYVIPIIDVKLSNTFLGATHLPSGAIAALLLLGAVNPLLGLLWRGARFSRNEMLVVYISCLFSCLVPGHGSESFVVGALVGPFYFATRENAWMEWLEPYVKPWLTPALGANGEVARPVVEGWYQGGASVPWGAWMVPLIAWTILIGASYLLLGCLSVMLRAQWAGREALTFPLLQLPLEMTQDDTSKSTALGGGVSFWRNPLMWVGVAIVAGIETMRGLNLYFPDVPTFPLEIQTGALFTEAPWNQMGWTPMTVYPLVVGLAFLLTAEVGFSIWSFFLFLKFQLVLAYLIGFQPDTLPSLIGHTMGAKTFLGLQQVGAYWAYVAVLLWTAREHLQHIWARAMGRRTATLEERDEALSYPVAFWGFVASFALLVGWSVLAGMRLDAALALWLTYLVIAIALSRVVVESGLLFVQAGWTPLGAWAQLLGSGQGGWLGTGSLVPGAFIQTGMMTDMRGFVMPSFLHAFKLAHERGIRARPLLGLIAAVIAITLVMGLVMRVRLGYETGGLSLNGWFAVGGAQSPANVAQSLMRGTPIGSLSDFSWLATGALVTLGLVAARSRLAWLPLHPIGYLMALTYPMHMLWFSVFLGWMTKILMTRYGGTSAAREARPLFLGLVLGGVTMMILWLLVDALTGRTGHQLAPG